MEYQELLKSEKFISTVADLLLEEMKGGEGSGNFGHAGRQGEVGGSGEGASGSNEKWVDKLSGSQKRIFKTWANGDQWIIRNYQMQNQTDNKEVAKMLKNMDDALKIAPKANGILYRGLETSPGFNPTKVFAVGTTYKLNAHSSASPDLSTAACFAKQGRDCVILSIKSKTGADISQLSTREFKWQNEHILQSGTSYKVEKIEAGKTVYSKWGPRDDEPERKRVTIVHLREL